MLLLEPNTARSTTADNVSKAWGIPDVQYQVENCKYWDRTYIYGVKADGTVGGMSTATGGLYDYCYQLTLGGVGKGTWYVPTQAQLQAVWTMYSAINGNESYVTFDANDYFTSSEDQVSSAHVVRFHNGYVLSRSKTDACNVRCVRDSPDSGTSGYATEVNGYPVIDLSLLTPLGCVLTSKEAADRNTAMNQYTPSDETCGEASGQYGSWNAKMSPKFQVACTNLAAATWASAYDGCKKYAYEGGTTGQWRLPTLRELTMIWVLYPQLWGKGGFTGITSSRLWTCTETDTTGAMMVGFGYGDTYAIPKTDKCIARCVRDIQ